MNLEQVSEARHELRVPTDPETVREELRTLEDTWDTGSAVPQHLERRAVGEADRIVPWRCAEVSRCAPPHLRQLPPARSHILAQHVSLIRRPDPEVPVIRRAPLVQNRQDLDALVPTGDAARRFLASMPRVAVDDNRDGIAHPPECSGGGRPCAIAAAAATRRRYVWSRVFSGPARRRLPRPVSIPSEAYDDRSDGGLPNNCLDQPGVRTRRREPPYHLQLDRQREG